MNKALFFEFYNVHTIATYFWESSNEFWSFLFSLFEPVLYVYMKKKRGFSFFFFFKKKKRCFSLFQPRQDFYIFFNNAVVKWHFCTQICWKFFFWKKAGNSKFHLSGSSLEEVLSFRISETADLHESSRSWNELISIILHKLES